VSSAASRRSCSRAEGSAPVSGVSDLVDRRRSHLARLDPPGVVASLIRVWHLAVLGLNLPNEQLGVCSG